MEVRELTCIGCPLGCSLTVKMDGETIEVKGNTCRRGEDYAKKEVTNPTRIVTSSVHVTGGNLEMVSVKTQRDIPKDKIFAVMEEIRKVTAQAPVAIGDVLIDNCAGTGVSVVATKNVERC
ncbi:MAG TPA: DUF1667 domain-containing protein [Candidatus Cottocaccamicrobium excrementipullorum]|nr:DUF1667 domain-containing protein [Candidatus Cottocaccamicrobium excrementipullorum]